ncbi:MAG: hypothetical protein AB1671_15245 [Thermodesulfobacteriota bacterium]
MTETHQTYETGEHRAADANQSPAGRYESYTLNVRPIALAGVGLTLLVGVSFLLMDWLFDYFSARQAQRGVPPMQFVEEQQPPPGPHLQVAPHADLLKLRAAEDAVLNSYGWVNRDAGTVRIPIDRAIELLAERGLPARDGAAAQSP